MKVGIVVAVHNGAQYLAEAIESVVSQDYIDWKMVIVDDGSSDDSLKISHSLCQLSSNIQVLHHDCCGVSKTRNRGADAQIALGCDALLFLDQDDVLLPNAISGLITCLTNHPEAVVAVGSILPIDSGGELLKESSWLNRSTEWHIKKYGQCTFDTVSVRELMYACSIATPGCCLIRTEAFKTANGFDTEISMCEDWDLWLRMSQIGSLSRISLPTLKYRYHQSNTHRAYDVRKYALARDRTRMNFLATLKTRSKAGIAAREGYLASLAESIVFSKSETISSIKSRDVKGVLRSIARSLALTTRKANLRLRSAISR